MSTVSVSKLLGRPYLDEVYRFLRLAGKTVLPPDSKIRPDAEILPFDNPHEFKPHVLSNLRHGITTVAVSIGDSCPPHVPGYRWLRQKGPGVLSRCFVLRQVGSLRLRDIVEPGDHPMPTPVQQPDGSWSWQPRCFVKVADIARMPLWILDGRPDWGEWRMPFVYLDGQDKDNYTSDLEKKGEEFRFYPLTKQFFTPEEIDRRWMEGKIRVIGEQVFAWKKVRGHKKAFLTGQEILDRVPWEQSFIMSVAGWPLRWVPIKYLVFLASEGNLKTKYELGWDASFLKVTEVYKKTRKRVFRTISAPKIAFDNGIPSAFYHLSEKEHEYTIQIIERTMGCYGSFRIALFRYLRSAEGVFRMRAAGIHHEKGERCPLDPEVEYDRWDATYGLAGCWTDDNDVLSSPEVHASMALSTPRATILIERIFTEDFKERAKALGLSPLKLDLLLKRERRLKEEALRVVPHFSVRDVDRFGLWGSQPVSNFIFTGKTNSKSRKVLASQLEGDTDPTPVGMSLGVTDTIVGHRKTADGMSLWDRWSTSLWEPDAFDWQYPAAPTEEDDAYDLGWRMLNELDVIKRRWERLHWDAQRANIWNPDDHAAQEDRDAFLSDQFETRDHLDYLGERYCLQVQWSEGGRPGQKLWRAFWTAWDETFETVTMFSREQEEGVPIRRRPPYDNPLHAAMKTEKKEAWKERMRRREARMKRHKEKVRTMEPREQRIERAFRETMYTAERALVMGCWEDEG